MTGQRPTATTRGTASSSGRLPRGTCSTCGRDVALRRGGAVREHTRPAGTCMCGHLESEHSRFRRNCLHQECGCVKFGPPAGTCPGSGQPSRTA